MEETIRNEKGAQGATKQYIEGELSGDESALPPVAGSAASSEKPTGQKLQDNDTPTRRKQSIVATMRASLENNTAGSSSRMVHNINDFYKQQKTKKAGDSKEKGEAKYRMHHFRGTSLPVEGSTKKATNASKPSQIENEAATQAAAPLSISNAPTSPSDPSGSSPPPVKGPVAIRSLADFYQFQRAQRHEQTVTRQNAVNQNHGFHSPATSNRPSDTYVVSAANESTDATRKVFETKQQALEIAIQEAVPAEYVVTTEEVISADDSATIGYPTELNEEGDIIEDALVSKARTNAGGDSTPVEPLVITKVGEEKKDDDFDKKNDAESNKDANSSIQEKEAAHSSLAKTAADSTAPVSSIDENSLGVSFFSYASIDNPMVAVDYKASDYRGFVFCVHEQHGLMLLHCTRKAKKGPHYQLPGGHVDEPEFLAAAQASHDAHAQLMIACQMGAARELFEETGIDVRDKLYRMEPAALRNGISTNKHGMFILACELKKRLYFFLPITDDDFISPHSVGERVRLSGPMTAEGSHLRLKLSVEHSGFNFEKDPEKSAKLLEQHSGGNGSKALLMSMQRKEEEDTAAVDESIEVSSIEDLTVEPRVLVSLLTKDHMPSKVDRSELDLLSAKSPATETSAVIQVLQEDEPPSCRVDESKIEELPEVLTTREVVPLLTKEQPPFQRVEEGETSRLIDEGGDEDDPVEKSSHIFQGLPSDLLPPPKRKNVFACCFGM